MRCSMLRRCNQYVDTIATANRLRYSVADARFETINWGNSPRPAARRLCCGAEGIAADAGVRWGVVYPVCTEGEVGRIGRIVQRLVPYGASDAAGGIERTLAGRRTIGRGGTYFHVSRRWNRMDRASVGGRFCDRWVREYQRNRGETVGV